MSGTSNGEEHLILPHGWSAHTQAIADQSNLGALTKQIGELPGVEWVLEDCLPPLVLIEPERPHRLKIFMVASREVFALIRGAGELLIGFVPREGQGWVPPLRVDLHGFDGAWEEVIQVMPLPQPYSETVALAIVTRNGRVSPACKLYRAVVDLAGAELRLIPALESQQPKDSRVWARPLPHELEPLSRFPIEARETLNPAQVGRRLADLALRPGEQELCVVVEGHRWLVATSFDRLHDSPSPSQPEANPPAHQELTDRVVSIDVRHTADGQALEALLTTEDAQLLAITMTSADSRRAAGCPRDAMISTTESGKILLAHHGGLALVDFTDARAHRTRLVAAIAVILGDDWNAWLSARDRHEIPKRVGVWLEFQQGRGFAPSLGFDAATRQIQDWARGSLAGPLGREFIEVVPRWIAQGPHWAFLRQTYDVARHPFRREIDAVIREGGLGSDHAELLMRARRSSFEVVDDLQQAPEDRVDAAINISLTPYLGDATIWLDLEPNDQVRAVAAHGARGVSVLLSRRIRRLDSPTCAVETLGSTSEAPPRFIRGSAIGLEHGLLEPAGLVWPEARCERCVDALVVGDSWTALLRERIEGSLVIWTKASEPPQRVALPVPAPCSFDLHPDRATVVVVGERTPDLHWLRLDGGEGGRVGLPDLPCCVRFSIDGTRLLVGTTQGLVCCFAWGAGCRELLWSYCTRGRALRLDLRGDRILVVAPREEIALLSLEGRRIWRLRRRRLQDAAWLPDGGIVVAMRDGQLTYVRPGQRRADRIRELAEHLPDHRRAAARLALGQPEVAAIDELDRDDRLVLLAGLAQNSPDQLPWQELSARDLAGVARSVAPDVDDWKRVFEAATTHFARGVRGMSGLTAQATAIAECLGRLPEIAMDRTFAVRQLARVPAQAWRSELHAWLEVLAASLLVRDTEEWPRILEDAAALPFAVLHAAAALAPASAGPCRSLARAAELAARDPQRLEWALAEVTRDLKGYSDDLAHVLRTMASIACTPTLEVSWQHVQDCIGYARLLSLTAGRPLITLANSVHDGLPSEAPEHQAPLFQQQAWLQAMLGHGFRVATGDLESNWIPLIDAWMGRLRERFHAAGQRQLLRVVSTTRVQPELEFDGVGRFRITLTPEGNVDLEDVVLELRLEAEHLEPVTMQRQLVRLRPSDPPLHESLDLAVTYQRQVELTIRVLVGDNEHDTSTWKVPIRPAEFVGDPMLLPMPNLFSRVIAHVQALHAQALHVGDLIIVARPADLEVIAATLERSTIRILADIAGTDWRYKIGRGVLFPATRRALARLADPPREPSTEPRTWLLPPALGTRLALHLEAPLLHICRANALVSAEALRNGLTTWLRGRHVNYEDAQSLLQKTEGDLRACHAHATGGSVDLAMVEALREDLGGVGPMAIAALLCARREDQRNEVHERLAKVAPLAPYKDSLARLGLLDDEDHASDFVVAVERIAGGPDQLLSRLTGDVGLLGELPFDRLPDLGFAALRQFVPRRLDDRQVTALIALGRLWQGNGGTSAIQQLANALTHESQLRLSPKQSRADDGSYSERIGEWTLLFVSDTGDIPPIEHPCIALGPGVARISAEANVHPLDIEALRRILAAENWWQSLLATVRAQGGVAPNPFRSHGALEPGHPLFVGRKAIRRDFLRNITKRHFLLVGPRRIGKTSLMNQLYHDAQRSETLRPLWAEAQGIHDGNQLPALQHGPTHNQSHVRSSGQPWLEHLRERIAPIKQEGLTPVLFVNEIDGLAADDPKFLNGLRGELENGLRMVAVGYTKLVRAVHRPGHFFYHLTSNAQANAPYNRLGVLEPAAGRELVDQFKHPSLGFWWATREAEELGRAELVERSMGIPWLLQDLCALLLDRLTEERRGVIYLDDVRHVIAHAPTLLEQFHQIDFASLLPEWPATLPSTRISEFARFILAIVVRKLYFQASPPVAFNELGQSSSDRFVFKVATVERILHEAVLDLPYSDAERTKLLGWISMIALSDLLLGLTLTLLLESTYLDGDEAYAFLGNIYPLELWRQQARGGRTIDDRILDLTTELLST